MPKKRHKPEEIVAKLRQVDVLTSQGAPLAEAIRPHAALGWRPPAPAVLVGQTNLWPAGGVSNEMAENVVIH